MVEIEGVIQRIAARETDTRGWMQLVLVLRPWSRVGAADASIDPVQVLVPMDLDEADWWMRTTKIGESVRVACDSLTEASPDGPAQAMGRNVEFVLTNRPGKD
jgi:hypothetical protein